MPFYKYGQNNSGGSFDVTDTLCHNVVIEANSASEADDKLKELGGYFDGCDEGIDCDCCGDRWYRAWSAVELPIKWDSNGTVFNTIEEYVQFLADKYGWTVPDCRIFYKDGTVKEFFKKEKV